MTSLIRKISIFAEALIRENTTRFTLVIEIPCQSKPSLIRICGTLNTRNKLAEKHDICDDACLWCKHAQLMCADGAEVLGLSTNFQLFFGQHNSFQESEKISRHIGRKHFGWDLLFYFLFVVFVCLLFFAFLLKQLTQFYARNSPFSRFPTWKYTRYEMAIIQNGGCRA